MSSWARWVATRLRVLREPRAGRALREDGDTLVEILITIMILSFGVTGIYAALTSSIVAGDRVKSRADIAQLVTRVSDAVQRSPWDCGDPISESFSGVLRPLKPSSSWDISVVAISHWARSRTFEDGCPTESDDLFRTLKVTVAITAPGARGTQSVELIKRP